MTDLSDSSNFIIKNALLSSRLSKRVGHCLSVHGMSMTEFLVLHSLEGAPRKALSRIELAELLGMSASGITRLVAPMEKIGLVSKESNPRDARQSLVKISETGQRLYSEASVGFDHISNELTENISSVQLEKILELYGRVK